MRCLQGTDALVAAMNPPWVEEWAERNRLSLLAREKAEPITYTPIEAIEHAMNYQRPRAAVEFLKRFSAGGPK